MELCQLTALRELNLSGNQLVSVPPELGQLTALEELCLHSNQLSTLPPQLKKLRNLMGLFLHDNPALNLSPAVLGPDPRKASNNALASAQAILDFYFSRQTQATRPLNEVKMILVGRGAAGKTSTVRALMGEEFREREESTPGIALCDWKMDGCQGEPVTAHVWDFAGQVITHALHQFFFSVRSVYVVVLTGRENSEREDAEYWLRLIKAFGTDAEGNGPPVLVALNKWELPGCRPRLDRAALKERYPFIRGFVELDCKSGRGVDELRGALCREVEAMAWVREPFAVSWDDVRRALAGEDGREKRAHLPYAEYRRLCVDRGVVDERHQDSLAEILHNLGAALNYRNDPRLREATVLQPEWLTNHVYQLMRRAEAQEGLLKQADLPEVLKDEPDETMRAYLVQLMERFEIAYPSTALGTSGPQKPEGARPLDGARGDRPLDGARDLRPLDGARDLRPLDGARDLRLWLVPQALPDNQPAEAAALAGTADATRLRYSYPALPEGLVARAIVRLHELIEEADGHRQQWASGAILARDGARALLRKEPQDRVVMVTVTGPAEARQALAGLCQAVMRDIHKDIPGLDPLEETLVEGEWIKTKTLERDEKLGRQTGINTEERGTVMIDPEATNNAFTKKPARQEEVWKPSVFISYSKKQREPAEAAGTGVDGAHERGVSSSAVARPDDRSRRGVARIDPARVGSGECHHPDDKRPRTGHQIHSRRRDSESYPIGRGGEGGCGAGDPGRLPMGRDAVGRGRKAGEAAGASGEGQAHQPLHSAVERVEDRGRRAGEGVREADRRSPNRRLAPATKARRMPGARRTSASFRLYERQLDPPADCLTGDYCPSDC